MSVIFRSDGLELRVDVLDGGVQRLVGPEAGAERGGGGAQKTAPADSGMCFHAVLVDLILRRHITVAILFALPHVCNSGDCHDLAKRRNHVRVGVFTALLAQLSLDDVLKKLKSLNIDTVELGTGNYPGDPHCKLSMLENKAELQRVQEEARRQRLHASAR